MTTMSEDAVLLRTVGRRVRGARLAAGLSQAQLAQRIGMTRSSVSNLEAGRQDMNITRIAGILSALGLDLSALVQPDDLPVLRPLPLPPHEVVIRSVLEVSCSTCGGTVLDVTESREKARGAKAAHIGEMLMPSPVGP
jgi:DNA-binding XRE family transcriptional regulator